MTIGDRMQFMGTRWSACGNAEDASGSAMKQFMAGYVPFASEDIVMSSVSMPSGSIM